VINIDFHKQESLLFLLLLLPHVGNGFIVCLDLFVPVFFACAFVFTAFRMWLLVSFALRHVHVAFLFLLSWFCSQSLKKGGVSGDLFTIISGGDLRSVDFCDDVCVQSYRVVTLFFFCCLHNTLSPIFRVSRQRWCFASALNLAVFLCWWSICRTSASF